MSTLQFCSCRARAALRIPLLVTTFLAGAGAGPFHADLSAQSIRGRVVLDVDSSPVEGMFMALVDSETGERKGGALTDASGLFMIRVSAAGTFRLRGERIGLRTVASGPHTLAPGSDPFLELATAPEAVALEGLNVEGEERCRVDPEVGSATAQVWEEVRKALDVVAWSSEAGLYQYNFSRFERELDEDGRRVRSEYEQSFTGWSKNPYVSVPPEQLALTGFATGPSGPRTFYAPDANALLSDEFLAGHCFRLEREETDAGSRLGLAFEPVDRTGGVDIEGVLWLDEATGLLDRVDFRYLDFDPEVRSRRIGGTVEFRPLESGAWIVPRWVLRLPLIGIRSRPGSSGTEHVLIGIREEGGEVARVLDAEDARGSRADRARGRISGMVFDSTAGVALADAHVYASGTSYAATTDADGSFEIMGLRPGEYTLGVTHSRLDSLGLRVRPRHVLVRSGATSRVELAVPGLTSAFAEELCPPNTRSDTTAVLVGVVRDRTSGVPLSGATVKVSARSWTFRNASGGAMVRQNTTWQETDAGVGGHFAFCQVPSDEYLLLDANHLGREARPDSVRIRRTGDVERKDIQIRMNDATFEEERPAPDADAAPVYELPGVDVSVDPRERERIRREGTCFDGMTRVQT